MRLRLALIASLFVGLGLLVVFVGGAPSTADGSTTEGAGPRATENEPRGGSGATEGNEPSLMNRRLAGFTEGFLELMARVPTPPSHEQVQAGAQVIALFNEFDLEAAAGLYEKPSVGQEEWVQWLRAGVGECGAGEPMMVKDDSVRYRHPCERGELEVQFKLSPESGKIGGIMMGARGIPLADPVREAAETVMRLYDQWDPALFRASFSEKFEEEKIRRFLLDVRSKHGDCSLGEPDLVSVRGALILLNCERSTRLMKIELMQEDDRIKVLSIRDPRQ
ncbi:hypothetical protein [Nannocystis punicea]|uniref:Lipoprotein n=1 Tax=Nannocystis punicea TaxID=2995304 RepID=A0ABY7H2H2_9BACT|nr:hypothetical protein [Nannocystis poenicansa]WAS93463.1 hypothetical protein O0S08_45595 [Nannocystis poenicansa]